MDGICPKIDIIVIQMDGDVIRKEKEVHCQCETTICEEKEKCEFPLYCKLATERLCPIELPCCDHTNEEQDIIAHGRNVLDKTLGETDKNRIVITIPCDSTDTWIAANVCGYTPVNLGKLIKGGILSDIESIHRKTIDRQIEKKLKKGSE